MKVVILAGGLGTRLAEYTGRIPKPLVKIGTMPIIWHVMKIYSQYGFNEFILPLGYKGELIKEFFLNLKYFQSKMNGTLLSECISQWQQTFKQSKNHTLLLKKLTKRIFW